MFNRLRTWWQNRRQKNQPENTDPAIILNELEPQGVESSESLSPVAPPASPVSLENYPASFPRLSPKAQAQRARLFDPSLKHYTHAFSLADPRFQDEATAQAWKQARSQVIAHLLRLISDSPWQKHLILRGSLLLKAWLGNAAREPKDIDWVFQPEDVGKDEPLGRKLVDDLYCLVAEAPMVDDGKIIIQVDKIGTDEIWTYERASGRRIVFPWIAEGLPPGEVQMDVVFQEELPELPIRIDVANIVSSLSGMGGGDRLSVLSNAEHQWLWAASRRLSLAWKVMWLATDTYPQGKDWYDATLLAEQVDLPVNLLKTVLDNSEEDYWIEDLQTHQFLNPDDLDLDWDNFVKEYPEVDEDFGSWKSRFFQTLGPTISALPDLL